MKKLNTQLMQRLKDANGRNAELEARVAALEARLSPSSSPVSGTDVAAVTRRGAEEVPLATPTSALPPTSPASTKENSSPRDDYPTPPQGPLFSPEKQPVAAELRAKQQPSGEISFFASFVAAVQAFIGRIASAFRVLTGAASVSEASPLLGRSMPIAA